VYFPFDLHSAAVLIHTCHAVPLLCHEYAFLKATSQCHSRFMTRSWQGDGMLAVSWSLAILSSRKFVIRSVPISDAVASVKQRTLGEWQGSGRVVAGSWQGNGMLCVNRPLKRQGNSMGTAWYVWIRLYSAATCCEESYCNWYLVNESGCWSVVESDVAVSALSRVNPVYSLTNPVF
jgi:hypothetical protein